VDAEAKADAQDQEIKVNSGKGPKWFDQIDEFSINIQASFVGYAM
jgi:hypothetical protein